MTEITHTVVVTPDEEVLARVESAYIGPVESDELWDAYAWRIECSDPAACEGWIECLEAHEVDGVSAAEGPYLGPEDAPWYEEEHFVFHGKVHEWQGGHMCWSLPVPGCPIVLFAEEVDVPMDRPGRWVVDTDWGDWGPIVFLAYPEEWPRA